MDSAIVRPAPLVDQAAVFTLVNQLHPTGGGGESCFSLELEKRVYRTLVRIFANGCSAKVVEGWRCCPLDARSCP